VPEGGKVSAEQTERARMLPKSKKHSDTSPVCQRHRIAVLSCFILPGLPSQALARQLSQRESPWQRGFVFDKTDLRLLENVTECQSLSLWERWHGEAKMSERLYRAAPALFRSLERRPLSNLSVSHPLASSPGRRALGKEVSFSMKPTGAYWKTSRNAKASHFGRGGTAKP
jgi:hypothetical protein